MSFLIKKNETINLMSIGAVPANYEGDDHNFSASEYN